MLSKKSIESAIVLANLLNTNDKILFVKDGTLLSSLESTNLQILSHVGTDATAIQNGNTEEFINKVQIFTNGQMEREEDGESFYKNTSHDIILGSSIDVLTGHLASNIEFARSFVNPQVSQFKQLLSNEITNSLNQTRDFLNLEGLELPDFLESDTIQHVLNHPTQVTQDWIPVNFEGCELPLKLRELMSVNGTTNAPINNISDEGLSMLEGLIHSNSLPKNGDFFLTSMLMLFWHGFNVDPYLNTGLSSEANREAASNNLGILQERLKQMISTYNNEVSLGYLVSPTSNDIGSIVIRSGVFYNEVPKVFVYNQNVLQLQLSPEDTIDLLAYAVTSDLGLDRLKVSTLTPESIQSYIDSWRLNVSNFIPSEKQVVGGCLEESVMKVYGEMSKELMALAPRDSLVPLEELISTKVKEILDHHLEKMSTEELISSVSSCVVADTIYSATNAGDILRRIESKIQDPDDDVNVAVIRVMADLVSEFMLEQVIIEDL